MKISEIKQTCLNLKNNTYRCAKYVVNKIPLESIQKNLIESGAYTAGFMVAMPIGKQIGKKLGSFTSKTAGIFLGYLGGKIVLNQEGIAVSSKTQKALTITLAALTSLSIYTLTTEQTESSLEYLGASLGENILGFTSGVLASFAATRFMGSQEVLLSQDSFCTTYAGKALISLAGTALFSHLFPMPNPFIQFAADSALGNVISSALEA